MKYQIGKNIRILRRKRQVSQEDLAETMGVTVQAVSKWETGKANPDLELLPRLAEYFGVTIDSLFLVHEADNILLEEDTLRLERNSAWWDAVPETERKAMRGLPNYGFFTPAEDTLGLVGDVWGKTVLELACGELSGGQWQRLASARSYYRQRPLLFLDEPTAAIDPLEEMALYGKLNELAEDKTVVLITHRLGAVRNADKIIVLDGGSIAEMGSFAQLIKQKGRFHHIWQEQAKWYQETAENPSKADCVST